MFTSLTELSKSSERMFIEGNIDLIFFSIPFSMIWLAMQPNGCRLTTWFIPWAAYVAISPEMSQPSPNCALSVISPEARSAYSRMSSKGMK